MGESDCFCAFCSGPIVEGFLELGKKGPKYLAARKKRLDREIRKRNGEVVEDGADEDEGMSDEGIEDDEEEESEEENSDDGSEESVSSRGEWGSWEERNSYDPRLVSNKTVRWTSETSVLGFNPDANTNGIDRAWEGSGRYDDYVGRSLRFTFWTLCLPLPCRRKLTLSFTAGVSC